jgi:ankyrin repeat protein
MSVKYALDAVLKKYCTHPEFIGVDLLEPNQPSVMDNTVLHLAACRGDVESIKVLIDNGVDINQKGDMGNTALHQAVLMGRLQSVITLVSFGADIDALNEFDQRAIDIAAITGEEEIQMQLKKKARRPK